MGGKREKQYSIARSRRVFPTCTDTCSFETGRNVRFGGGGFREKPMCGSRITRSKQGDDSRCQYVTTISVNNGTDDDSTETLHPAQGRGEVT